MSAVTALHQSLPEAPMQDRIARRLAELRAELEAGHHLQAELDARRDELQRSMLRISGAIQVLGELTASEVPAEGV